jgi:predicted outer membrane repeat protein
MRLLSPFILLLMSLLLLNALDPAAAQVAPILTVAGSSGKTTCSLNILGNSAGDGIKSASLSCTGAGSVEVAVHQQLKKVLVLKGATIAKKGTCQLSASPCLLLLCRSDAEFVKPVITGVKFAANIWGILCFFDGTKVTLRNGQFTSCGLSVLSIIGDKTSALIDQCSFQGNTGDGYGVGIYFDAGTMRVQSSTFTGNAASMASSQIGGAIYLQHGVTTIVDSNFHSNSASYGGAVAAVGDATVSIQGSRFVGNRAGWSGAAIYADGNAQVDILPAAKQGPGMKVAVGVWRCGASMRVSS